MRMKFFLRISMHSARELRLSVLPLKPRLQAVEFLFLEIDHFTPKLPYITMFSKRLMNLPALCHPIDYGSRALVPDNHAGL